MCNKKSFRKDEKIAQNHSKESPKYLGGVSIFLAQGQVHEKGDPVTGQLGRPQGENTGKKRRNRRFWEKGTKTAKKF